MINISSVPIFCKLNLPFLNIFPKNPENGSFDKKEDVSTSAKRVFIVNRIGDTAFFLAVVLLLYFSIQYLNIYDGSILMFTSINTIPNELSFIANPLISSIIGILLVLGAIVKSAQFPFNLWLIDAMKAPTPISALIHSATMVCMGIFLILRAFLIFSDVILNLILIIGILTAFICSFIAISQTNIKKILAYSTSSQLGLMFVALGLKEPNIAIFYLLIHSFTKALLFLLAGSVEQKFRTQNILDMGALRKVDFLLALCWIVGALSLSGIFFGGFASKEMLLNLIKDTDNNILLVIFLITSFFTSFYIFKTYFNVFEYEQNREISREKAKTMQISIIAITIFVILSFIFVRIIHFNLLCVISVLIGILGIINAYLLTKTNRNLLPDKINVLSYNEVFLPQIYSFIANVFYKFVNIVLYIEKYVFDFITNFIAFLCKKLSNLISKIQNGNIQSYVSYSIFSIGIIFVFLVVAYIIVRGGM